MELTTITNPSDFGIILRSRRKILGYTQAKVAALCNTGIRYISDLENGKVTIELGKALIVASTLGLNVMLGERGAAP